MRSLNHITALVLSVILLCVFSYSTVGLAETDTVEAKEPQEKKEKKYVTEDGIVHLQREMDIVDLIKAVSEINDEVYLIEDDIKPKEVSIIRGICRQIDWYADKRYKDDLKQGETKRNGDG